MKASDFEILGILIMEVNGKWAENTNDVAWGQNAQKNRTGIESTLFLGY